MAMILNTGLLNRLLVSQARRKQVCMVRVEDSLRKCIGTMIKYKVGAVLVRDASGKQLGIISKTDVLGCYYAGLGLDTLAAEVMVTPVLCCLESDSLKQAVAMMLKQDVKQLFVLDVHGEQSGILAFPDIVGLLYRACFDCSNNMFNRQGDRNGHAWLKVRDVMSRDVMSIQVGDGISRAVESILGEHFGALPVLGAQDKPAGVVSKTDLIRAYLHGLPLEEEVEHIMSSPPILCTPDCFLAQAIKLLILADVERLFVQDRSGLVTGVLSFSDAARLQSGSCKACQVGNW